MKSAFPVQLATVPVVFYCPTIVIRRPQLAEIRDRIETDGDGGRNDRNETTFAGPWEIELC